MTCFINWFIGKTIVHQSVKQARFTSKWLRRTDPILRCIPELLSQYRIAFTTSVEHRVSRHLRSVEDVMSRRGSRRHYLVGRQKVELSPG